MAAGEQISTDQKVGAAHKPVVHSPTEIGCTTCHGGQGQATEKDAAHVTRRSMCPICQPSRLQERLSSVSTVTPVTGSTAAAAHCVRETSPEWKALIYRLSG
jgi:hypothetical protein